MHDYRDRRRDIAEDLWDLEQVFRDPTCFGTNTSVIDYALTLQSELTGRWRDDEIIGRLSRFIAAESEGRTKEAFHHLGYVRRKLKSRWGVEPISSVETNGLKRRESPGRREPSVRIPASTPPEVGQVPIHPILLAWAERQEQREREATK